MKILLVIVITVFNFLSFGEDVKPKYQTMDLKQFENVNKPKSNPKVTFTSTCTTADGKVIEPGSAEYTTCMQNSKVKEKAK